MQDKPTPLEEPAMFKFDEELAMDDMRKPKATVHTIDYHSLPQGGLPINSGS
jgi:hypothetical protein